VTSKNAVDHHEDTEGTEEFIAFWQYCSLDEPFLCHPEDKPILQRRPHFADAGGIKFPEFIKSCRFRKKEGKLHLSLIPIPYMGDIRRADIFILALNPGVHPADYWAETLEESHSRKFRERRISTLRQQLGSIEFPFLGLDPAFSWHSGFFYWEKKLRELVSLIAEQWYGGSYHNALRSLANRLAVIELIPYHSEQFGVHSFIDNLPSVQAARRFVHQAILPAARRSKKTIIVTRQARNWGLDEDNSEYVCVYSRNQARGASLSPNSPGGEAILRHYREHPPISVS
jgi:hypothetical protein